MDISESNVPLSESWLEGQSPPYMEVVIAISEARKELKGWSEKQVRSAAEALDLVFDAWEKESGEREGLLGHLVLSDSIDLFVRLLKEKAFQPILEHISISQSIAVLILKEAAHENHHAALKGSTFLLNMKSGFIDAIGDKYEQEWFPHIRRGMKTLVSPRKGHEEFHGTPEEKHEKWLDYQAALEKTHREYPHWGITTVRQHVADNLDISTKTLQRRTKKTW